MAVKGGYTILDFKGISVNLKTKWNLFAEGSYYYDRIESSYRKLFLIRNLVISDVAQNDVFIQFYSSTYTPDGGTEQPCFKASLSDRTLVVTETGAIGFLESE